MIGEHAHGFHLLVIQEVGFIDFTDRCSPYCAFDLR
jgi:hypothetical protein